MVHPRKPIHRSTGKQRLNRLQFILEPIQRHTLLVWSVLALVAIGIGYEALSVLLNPEAVENPEVVEPEQAIAEITEEEPTLETKEQPKVNITVPWLWLGAIALGVGGSFLLWKTLQNPTAHKRAALNRRQRRGTPLLLEKPQPLRVPKRQPHQPITPFSPEQVTPEPTSPAPQPLEASASSPDLTPPTPAQPQKSFNFEVNRNPKPVQNSSLQVPNFPKLTPDIPQGSAPKTGRKKPPQDRQEQDIRKSS
ncbi:hypothetical protein [Roseofilum capinflatum]|uniref:Uncharacterized protein n=1 Tax=Roseofilum capinflatum BLCC-M114 TaxID=3022440 RepID=A0ABT7BBR3_9CYAN|nr:hypothetical protein [Roseofilum capinflatum]MDJ1176628.1 hypothetical protein [Roseofilum capinflatum BLCC-M114]